MRLAVTLGTAWGNFCRYFLRRDPLAFGFRRGAAFLTGLRLQVLAVSASQLCLMKSLPITVQLIGTEDDFVAPTDNIDLATGQDFFYLSVTGSTHEGIVKLDENAGPTGPRAMFRAALGCDVATLETLALKRADVFELYDESADDYDAVERPIGNAKVKLVVFIIHGIRDLGYWTRRYCSPHQAACARRRSPVQVGHLDIWIFPNGPVFCALEPAESRRVATR